MAHLDRCEICAWDISEKALSVAKENAAMNKVQITFECRDILKPVQLSKKFDVVVSNPPYVTPAETAVMRKNVTDYEPHQALFVDKDPLEFYQSICSKSARLLNTGGKVYFEINEAFGDQVQKLLYESELRSVKIIKDIHGKDRIASAIYSGK